MAVLPELFRNMDISFFINQVPGYFLWKDLCSVYLGSTANTAKLFGFRQVDDLVGKRDHEVPCDLAEFADQFVDGDKKIIKENVPIKMLVRLLYKNGEFRTLIVNKSLLKDDCNKPVAVQCHGIEVNSKILIDFAAQLVNEDLKKLVGETSKKKVASYYLNTNYGNLCLSNRESECLFYVIRGKSTRAIAEMLYLSPRTVESHLENIKHKMGVDRKEDVIEKAVKMGFMDIIPDGILSDQLNGLVYLVPTEWQSKSKYGTQGVSFDKQRV